MNKMSHVQIWSPSKGGAGTALRFCVTHLFFLSFRKWREWGHGSGSWAKDKTLEEGRGSRAVVGTGTDDFHVWKWTETPETQMSERSLPVSFSLPFLLSGRLGEATMEHSFLPQQGESKVTPNPLKWKASKQSALAFCLGDWKSDWLCPCDLTNNNDDF